MLIITAGPGHDRVVTEQRIEIVALQVGEFLQQGPGSGGGGEDAAHGGQGESAEADGPFEGGPHVVTAIVGHEGQQLLGLQFALDLLGQEAVEELDSHGPQLAEALP